MHTMMWRVSVAIGLLPFGGGLLFAGAGAAGAMPTGCYVDRGVTDAAALCHSGEGSAVLEAECLGFFVPPGHSGLVFGHYSGFESQQTKVGKPMRATCVSDGSVGIATLAFVIPAAP
ncbi:hypothetical protein OHA40_08045 [Nocardia sp. NBC_00508]|uniref:hypothetical protein n=1 Tax=Nocardia sp. NBC_00508 TaxID=2975992 RepID=UPI002E81F663|nr:hypothetical protein [Nocardia sp. NBC_00508]WUD68057.1 hypothetical protein OHA40_08045 [Nocardia sp. NBC_00508]